MKSRLKWQMPVSIIIGCCIFTFAAFGQTEIVRRVSIPDSASSNCENNAVLPIATEDTNVNWQTNSSQTGKRTAITTYRGFRFCSYKHHAQSSYSTYAYPDWLDANNLQGCQRACQMIDIPPPHCCLS